MDETDTGVELRVARQFFLKPWHSNQDDPNLADIEDGAHLFEARHSKAIRFVDQDERSWIDDLQFPFRELPCNVTIRRLRLRNRSSKRVVFVQDFLLVFFVPVADSLPPF